MELVTISCENQMFPAPAAPQLSPLPRIPPEIWQTILGRLAIPTDLHNARNACLEWRDILSTRGGELFPLVLSTVTHFLPVPTLLTCRLISRETKAIIDSTLQRHSSAHPDKYFNGHQTQRKLKMKQKSEEMEQSFYIFDSEDLCDRFLGKMGHPENQAGSNPFILGCIQLNLVDTSSFTNYCDQVIKMFQTYGGSVLSLKIEFGRGFASQVGILLTLLESLPNLRHLEVSTAPAKCFFISWPFHFEEIYEWIEKCELPRLVSLKVTGCKTCIGMGEKEYWDDWEGWKNKPRTVEGALYKRFEKQLVVNHES